MFILVKLFLSSGQFPSFLCLPNKQPLKHVITFHNVLQVKQDTYPEETANYTLRLVGTRDARIDLSASLASVVVVSSDHPYGIIDFVGVTSYNISEDVGLLTLNVVRNKGHTGRLLVMINVASSGATEGVDFEVSPKGLIILFYFIFEPTTQN